MYLKIAIFDFDSTLINTPRETQDNKDKWFDYYGKEWPYIGWWGRPESLDTDVFENEPNPKIVSLLEGFNSEENTLTVLLTGRRQKEKIIDSVKKY